MSNFKFKEGDLVEITTSALGNKGYRFVVGRFKTTTLMNKDGSVYAHNTKCYETDLKSSGENSKFRWSSECDLKLVNPDIDNISESTFSELMDEITQSITAEQ